MENNFCDKLLDSRFVFVSYHFHFRLHSLVMIEASTLFIDTIIEHEQLHT